MPKTPKANATSKPPKKKKAASKKSVASAGKGRVSRAAGTRSRSAATGGTKRTAARAAGTRKPRPSPPPVEQVLAPALPATPESLQGAMIAVEAARSKLAKNMLLLDLRGMADFTDYFFICSGTNPRQVQAICDEINQKMREAGLRTTHTEGYNHAEWVLLDFVDFVAHIFTEQAREYYDLERLWRTADRIPLSD